MKQIGRVLILLGLVTQLPLLTTFANVPGVGAGVVDVGNKFCPVSGDEISGEHFIVHEGKRYGMCCPMCEKKFRKNPEKYIANMADQETAGTAKEHGGKEHAGEAHAGHEHAGHEHGGKEHAGHEH